ncbi:MAG: MBOAT family O-acyltransferase [Pseudomonadota bacterium]
MNFASLQFAQFLCLVFMAYWLLRNRAWQNALLLGCSYYFYACWDPRFLALILFLTLTSYVAGARIAASTSAVTRKRWLVGYICLSLGVLGVFKYFNFFLDSAQALMLSLGWEVHPVALSIILPAAISFYTFESLSYVIEIHQGHLPKTTRLRDYALFIAYFPKLVAGPIERPAVLLPQLENDRHLSIDDFCRGLFLILLGLFKKVAIADGLAPSVDSVFNAGQAMSGTDIALASLAFTFQIYCDFSGYSDITRGVSKLFGINLSVNFRFPYFSGSPSEFWRRWHISLSTWLRDYVYIPLGGNRQGPWRTRLNLLLTMGLGGLWHGAAWNYVLWGLYQGLLLVGYAAWPAWAVPGEAWRRAGRWLAAGLFGVLMVYGWLLFRAHSLEQIATFTATLLSGPFPASTSMKVPPLSALLGIVVLLWHDHTAYREDTPRFYRHAPAWKAGWVHCCLIVATLMGLANARSAFIYFQF